ncbi:cache domain-containing protein [Methanorbis rubei]|uniref:Single Cache domain-containing protein n=1 Tax=Methanorbis rubei TaxID=3028300 RepID=A0AAE4MHP9_9EURY|nr:hypothetical protein [Methanocorpusculaceae archaeon Cs1]
MKYLVCLALGIFVVMSVCIAGCILPLPSDQSDESGDYIEQIKLVHIFTQSVGNSTSELGNSLFAAAEYQSDFAPDSPEVSASLSDLYVHNPSSLSVYRITADNVVAAAAPKTAMFPVGYQIPSLEFDPQNFSTLAYQDICQRDTGEFQMSVIVPVYTRNGAYDGFLWYYLDPMSKILVIPARSELPRDEVLAMILDENGVVLYSDDSKNIGQNAISAARAFGQYETAAALEKMISTKNGTTVYSTYSYGSMRYITLAAAWDTLETKTGPLTVVVGTQTAQQQLVPSPTSNTDKTLEEFVQSAYLYAVKNGKDATLAAINDPNGQFVTQEYAITAIDFNGTILASAMMPGDLGVNLIANKDANGVPTIRTLVQRAKQGGGYGMYLCPSHMQNQEIEVKLSYVVPIDDTWFVSAGSYMDEKAKYVDPELNNAMIEYTRHVAQYAAVNGKDATIAALNTPNGQFFDDNIKLVAVDSTGIVLARPYDPELIGNNIASATDIYGGSFGRDLMVMANSGGGMVYEYYPNRDLGENQITLMYVLPIDDTWFLVSGIAINAES